MKVTTDLVGARLDPAHFNVIKRFVFDAAGIHLADTKHALVSGRLGKRLRAHAFTRYDDYLRLLATDRAEAQIALDLLTTNETYFYREPQHFEFLRDTILPGRVRGQMFRAWSAACSSGEEPYSVAMTLADALGDAAWEVIGTDISSRVLEKARAGRYPLDRAHHIPRDALHRHCLKGIGPEEGQLLIAKPLRQRVRFLHANLNASLPDVGIFDLILLRNVMIYFQPETKRSLIERLATHLRPGGWLFIGHSESLTGLTERLIQVRPAIYRKP
ncbi:MAG: CheR family methyltransferase [Thiotrichales bacterium]